MAISVKHIISTPIGQAQVFVNSATAVKFRIGAYDSGEWAVINRVAYSVSLYLQYKNERWEVNNSISSIYKVGRRKREPSASALNKIGIAAVNAVTQWANENQDLLRETECTYLKEEMSRLSLKKNDLLKELEKVSNQICELASRLNKRSPQE